MVGPISFSGPSSGINFDRIIQQIIRAERTRVQKFNSQIQENETEKSAFDSLLGEISSLKSSISSLSKPSLFNSTSVTTSNDSILTATGDQVAGTGSFQFTPTQIAQTHQMLSSGFDARTDEPGSGTISLEVGKGFLDKSTSLDRLNGGSGVDRGEIRIVNQATGSSTVIDLRDAVTAKDVVERVNNDSTFNVKLREEGDRFVIENNTGDTINIESVGANTTAEDLGIDKTVNPATSTEKVGDQVVSISSSTDLEVLNDGLGVRFKDALDDFQVRTKLDDGGGSPETFNVNLTEEMDTVGDVVDAINTAASDAGLSVTASIAENGSSLVIEDNTGGASHPLEIQTVNNSNAALDLGFIDENGTVTPELNGVEDSANGDTLVGKRLNGGLNSRLRRTINGGSTLFEPDGTAVNDFSGIRDGLIEIQDREGDTVQIDLDKRNSTTITAVEGGGDRDVIEVSDTTGITEGDRIRITNGNVTEFKVVTEVSDIDADAAIEVQFEGQSLDASLGAGDGVHTDKESLKDIINAINNEAQDAGVDVTLSIDDDKNGLLLEDNTGATTTDLRIRDIDDTDGEADRVVQDLFGTAGAGSLGDVQVSADQIDGSDRDAQYIGLQTRLSDLNGGEGVDDGEIKITDRDGTSFEVDLGQSDDDQIVDVVREINNSASSAGSDLRAKINSTGDGIALEDSTGSNKIRVSNVGGTRTANDLNIEGESSDSNPGVLDGSFEFQIDVTSEDTLEDIVDKIENSDVSLSANLIDDGTDNNPIRISLLSDRSGLPGRITASSTISGLDFSTSSSPENARLLFGSDGSGSGNPALFIRSENRFKDIVEGLTVRPQSESDTAVTVNVDRDLQKVIDNASEFVKQYNKVIDSIKEKTKFNLDENERGPLVGRGEVQSTERLLARSINRVIEGIPVSDLNTPQEAGFSLDQEGKLSLDTNELRDQLETNFNEAREFFTRQRELAVDLALDKLNNGRGVETGESTDIEVFKQNGDSFEVELSGAEDVADVLRLINTHSSNNDDISIDIGPNGNRFVITSGGGAFSDTVDSVAAGGEELTDSALSGKTEEALLGAEIEMTSGANAGEVATVEAYDSSTNTLTLSDPIATSGDTYSLEAKVGATNINDTRTASTLGINVREDPGKTSVKGSPINVEGDPGFSPRTRENLNTLDREDDGLLTGAVDGISEEIERLEDEIEDVNESIEEEKERLTKQFARLEQFLATQQRTMSRIQQSLFSFRQAGGGGGLSQLL